MWRKLRPQLSTTSWEKKRNWGSALRMGADRAQCNPTIIMIHFRLFRIPISIHWTFFLLTAFLGGAIRAQEPDDWFRVLVFMLAAFHSVIIHELGHALTGLKSGASQSVIHLHGMGGSAMFPNTRFDRGKSILVTAAGPAASILLALLFFGISQSSAGWLDVQTRSGYFIGYFISVMVFVNVFWTIINLMPILPLDGGQILRDVLGPRHLKVTCIIGFATLAVLAVLLWIFTQSFFNMVLILILGSYTWRVWQSTQQS